MMVEDIWGRLRRIANGELEILRLNFTGCAIREAAPIKPVFQDLIAWQATVFGNNALQYRLSELDTR